MATEKTLELQKKKVTVIGKFWQGLILNKNIKAAVKFKERTIGYLIKHPLKKIEPHKSVIGSKTTNHAKKSSKSRRLMAKASRKINRGK